MHNYYFTFVENTRNLMHVFCYPAINKSVVPLAILTIFRILFVKYTLTCSLTTNNAVLADLSRISSSSLSKKHLHQSPQLCRL